jgi:hypothetical protein
MAYDRASPDTETILANDPNEHPAGGDGVAGTIELFLSGGGHGHLHRRWIDVIKQNSVRSHPTEEDFPYFRRLNGMVASGQVALRCVPVGDGPGSDKEDAFNNSVLSLLPHPFRAEFRGGSKQEADGHLEWVEDVAFDWCPGGPLGSCRPIMLPPGVVALEVGTTSSWATHSHVTLGSGVARWPYGSRFVTIVARVPGDVLAREKAAYLASIPA